MKKKMDEQEEEKVEKLGVAAKKENDNKKKWMKRIWSINNYTSSLRMQVQAVSRTIIRAVYEPYS